MRAAQANNKLVDWLSKVCQEPVLPKIALTRNINAPTKLRLI